MKKMQKGQSTIPLLAAKPEIDFETLIEMTDDELA